MQRSLQYLFVLAAALSVPTVYSQTVAYVYVANNPKNSSTNEIAAWSAASDGKLTPIFGSPFRENVFSMAVNGKYLVASNRAEPVIDTFTLESDGALRYITSTNYAKYTSSDECGAANQLFFDHSGETLYIQEFDFDCANTGVTSFALNKYTGALKYLGVANTGAFPGDNNSASFVGNNVYAYTAVNSDCMYYEIYGFKRNSNGLLVSISAGDSLPATPPNVRRYVADLVTADPYDHLAVLMQPANPPGCTSDPLQLAAYTANSSGALTTSSKYENMPPTLIANPYDMKMSPSGKLVAVAGQQGLQVFHFNGADPITHDTGLLTSAPITQMFWDNNNHLYAISKSANKLYVFTIAPNSATEAPGSPYLINSPEDLIVQPSARR